MNLSELIYKRFAASEGLTKHLTTFDENPAVFSPEPPENNQEEWGSNIHYPRVVYNYDMQANEERNSVGTLSVSLLCQNTENIMPEAIEPEVRKCLRDVILAPEGGTPYCFAWARTDSFTESDNTDNPYMTIGCEIRFDIMEYPSLETTDPDPVVATNRYIKELFPECLVMGYDRMEEITEISAERPVAYCRLITAEKSEETNNVAWMDGRIAVHIFCPDSTTRVKIASAIANQMSLDGEIIMLDHSPMFIRRLQANYKSDYLKSGQIFVTGHYGLLRYKAKPHTMQQAHVEFG